MSYLGLVLNGFSASPLWATISDLELVSEFHYWFGIHLTCNDFSLCLNCRLPLLPKPDQEGVVGCCFMFYIKKDTLKLTVWKHSFSTTESFCKQIFLWAKFNSSLITYTEIQQLFIVSCNHLLGIYPVVIGWTWLWNVQCKLQCESISISLGWMPIKYWLGKLLSELLINKPL